jgi:lysophospholipase L1-like esterase
MALITIALLLPVVALVVVSRDYMRTLETARHCWWMRLLGRDGTALVIAALLRTMGSLPPRWRDARLHREARQKARALRSGRGLYLDTGVRVPDHAVLLAGSSTFTYWNRFAEDLAPLPVVNAAFGGSTTELVNQHFDELVEAFSPRVVCYFAGTNDITFGFSPETAVQGFAEFVRLAEEKLEGTSAIVYLGINTTPFTSSVRGGSRVAAVRKVNEGVRKFVQDHRGRIELVFVDLDSQSWSDDTANYMWDNHHLNEAGHARLGDLLRPQLSRFLDSPS